MTRTKLRICSRFVVAGLMTASVAMVARSEAGAAASGVPPTTYTKSVCRVIAEASKASVPYAHAITAAANAYKASPSAQTASAMRDAFASSLTAFGQQDATLLSALQSAGIPRVKNGSAFAAAFVAHVKAEQAEAAKLVPQVLAINVADSSQFASSLQQIVDVAKRDGDTFHAAARANPQFKNAPASLHPLVVFMIHDSDKCTKV
jgi:hypothetical protein